MIGCSMDSLFVGGLQGAAGAQRLTYQLGPSLAARVACPGVLGRRRAAERGTLREIPGRGGCGAWGGQWGVSGVRR